VAVVVGRAATKRQILAYTAMMVTVSLLPLALGFAGPIYGAVACLDGATLLFLAIRLHHCRHDTKAVAARRLFAFSIL
jgi:protoheme IX farnesyltransferase